MIIDCHTHVFPSPVKENRECYIRADLCFAELYSRKEAKLATADDLIRDMGRDGVDMSVILGFAWADKHLCRESNDYILESTARYPTRLIGFCAVPPDFGFAIGEVERCAGQGIKGVGELRLEREWLNSEAFSNLAAVLARRKLALLLHSSEPVGHSYPGKGDITPGVLYSFIAKFPDLTFICAHWGGGLPFYGLMPEVRGAIHNVYFDTAASPYLYRPQIYQHVSQLIGSDRILFGSDYPLLAQKRLIREINSATLSEEAKNMILGGNAQKLFEIKA